MDYRSRQRLRQKQRSRAAAPEERGKTVDEYLKLPYQITVVRDQDGGKQSWVARVDELPGCTTRARTPQEAVSQVSHALTDWIAAAIQEDRAIPEPKSAESHSGRLLLRMPRTLHGELAGVAERERTSLNQFITDVLAGAVGWRAPAGAARPVIHAGDETALEELGENQLSLEPESPSRRRWRRPARLVTAVLAVNFAIVALAGVVAILVLIAAWK